MIRNSVVLACVLALLLSAAPVAQAADLETDRLVAHELLWQEATAAVLSVAALRDVAVVPLDKLQPAQARLERAVVQLINSQPPPQVLPDHLLLLPLVQEVTAAARAAVDARQAGDKPGIASSQAWLDASLSQLAAAVKKRRPAAGSR